MAGTYASPVVIPTPNITNTQSVLIVPINTTRAQLYIFNVGPNTIWVSPVANNAGIPILATIGGQGSVPMSPSTGNFFPGFTTGMQAIASAGLTNVISVWEYYQ